MTALADLTEKQWAAQVYGLLEMFGFERYHTYRSKHSQPGYPDETCWRERVLWLELKREGGKLSPEQKRVIGGLAKAGAEVYVVRPGDLEDLGKILQARHPLWTSSFGAEPAALAAHLALSQRTLLECAL